LDIIDYSVLDLKNGKMAVLSGFGLGFEINYENVNKAHELYLASIL
jgi:L-alanine-DL-glutamate epimerase-like enolase superfamily enzyme